MKKIAIKAKGDEDGDDSDEMNELFPSDVSDDDEDDNDRFLLKEERGTKRKSDGDSKEAKKTKKVVVEVDVKTTQKKKKMDDEVKESVENMAEGDLADEVGDFNMSDEEDSNEELEDADEEIDESDDEWVYFFIKRWTFLFVLSLDSI